MRNDNECISSCCECVHVYMYLFLSLYMVAVIVGKETDIELFKGEQPLGLSLTDSWQVKIFKFLVHVHAMHLI